MTTWILVLALWPGSNSGQTVIVPNLPSYQECVRVDKEIRDVWSASSSGGLAATIAKSSCIEVRNAK